MNFDIWENIPGTSLKLLFKDKRYPDNPDKTQALPSFTTPPNRGDNYGGRVTAYYQVCIETNIVVKQEYMALGSFELYNYWCIYSISPFVVLYV